MDYFTLKSNFIYFLNSLTLWSGKPSAQCLCSKLPTSMSFMSVSLIIFLYDNFFFTNLLFTIQLLIILNNFLKTAYSLWKKINCWHWTIPKSTILLTNVNKRPSKQRWIIQHAGYCLMIICPNYIYIFFLMKTLLLM